MSTQEVYWESVHPGRLLTKCLPRQTTDIVYPASLLIVSYPGSLLTECLPRYSTKRVFIPVSSSAFYGQCLPRQSDSTPAVCGQRVYYDILPTECRPRLSSGSVYHGRLLRDYLPQQSGDRKSFPAIYEQNFNTGILRTVSSPVFYWQWSTDGQGDRAYNWPSVPVK